MNDDHSEAIEGQTGAMNEPIRAAWDRDESPTLAIVEAIASALDRDPMEMPPLYEVVETEALDAILQRGVRTDSVPVTIQFEYEGFDVTVDSRRQIKLQ